MQNARKSAGRAFAVVAASASLVAFSALAPASAATPKPKSYANCTALNKVYPHGVGRSGAKDKVGKTTKPVKNFKVSTTVYNLNNGPHKKGSAEYDLDRDNDGVACEKR